jgi:hypothetical protein
MKIGDMLCPWHPDMTLFQCKDLHEAVTPSITCPVCGMTSYNPNDIREGYCGNCADWTTPR